MYNTRIALIALLILQCLHSHAQKYSSYDAVANSNRKVFYSTNFDKVDENNTVWEMPPEPDNRFAYAFIKNGTLEITNNDDKGINTTVFPLLIDYSKDFEIEFRVMLDKKYPLRPAYVLWGEDTTNEGLGFNGQVLYFFSNGSYRMGYCQGACSIPCDYEKIRNTFGALSNKNDYNTYTIRKIKNAYYVFINREFSHEYKYVPIHGQEIGFGTNRKSVANMDYIQVSYLKLD